MRYSGYRSRSNEVVEAWITASVALIGGGWAIISGVHKRVTNVDTRLDHIELCMAKDYITRNEFITWQNKLEDHMVRIEEKLDRLVEMRRHSS